MSLYIILLSLLDAINWRMLHKKNITRASLHMRNPQRVHLNGRNLTIIFTYLKYDVIKS